MKTKAQEWYLVKKNWMEELEDLTDEQFGSLIRSLYSSQCPEGTQKVLYKALKDEFDRVNENREEGLKKRREASKLGNEVKAQSKPSQDPVGSPVGSRTHTHTHTQDTLQDTKDKLQSKGLYHPSMKIPNGLKEEEYFNLLMQ